MKLSKLKMRQQISTVFLCVTVLSSWTASSQAALGKRFAFIIVGPGGEEVFTKRYWEQANRLYDLLTGQLEYKPSQITFLFEKPGYDSVRVNGIPTGENVKKTFQGLSTQLGTDDQLLVFLIGHGTFDGDWSKFNLIGPDLKDMEYAQMLEALPTQKIIFVNTASASGPFVKKLSSKQRIIVTATKNGRETYETNFTDFLIDALASTESDFDKDNRVSIKEAFHSARASQDAWFEENKRLRAEHPLIDDNGDGKGSQRFEESDDGLWAKRVYLGPASRELRETIARSESGTASPKDELLLKKLKLEEQIEVLKAGKQQMSATEYAQRLEELLIKLALTNRKLKTQGRPAVDE